MIKTIFDFTVALTVLGLVLFSYGVFEPKETEEHRMLCQSHLNRISPFYLIAFNEACIKSRNARKCHGELECTEYSEDFCMFLSTFSEVEEKFKLIADGCVKL